MHIADRDLTAATRSCFRGLCMCWAWGSYPQSLGRTSNSHPKFGGSARKTGPPENRDFPIKICDSRTAASGPCFPIFLAYLGSTHAKTSISGRWGKLEMRPYRFQGKDRGAKKIGFRRKKIAPEPESTPLTRRMQSMASDRHIEPTSREIRGGAHGDVMDLASSLQKAIFPKISNWERIRTQYRCICREIVKMLHPCVGPMDTPSAVSVTHHEHRQNYLTPTYAMYKTYIYIYIAWFMFYMTVVRNIGND